MQIYPSILTGDENLAQHQLDLAQEMEDCQVVQLDIIDGTFADNLTLTPADFVQLDFGRLQADFHLMVEEPLDYVYEIKELKAQLPVRAIIAQVEKMSHQTHFLEEVHKEEWRPGLALDLWAPLEAIDQASWPLIKVVLIMAVEAGHQGQQFVPTTFKKVAELTALRQQQNLDFEIIVDGGVKRSMVSELEKLGVNGVAMGSELWQ